MTFPDSSPVHPLGMEIVDCTASPSYPQIPCCGQSRVHVLFRHSDRCQKITPVRQLGGNRGR